jgi:hypothetical protein
MIYASSKISYYFDIHSDISCNIRHFETRVRDPFSIPETQGRVKAGKCRFHKPVVCLTAQLLEYHLTLSNVYLDERKVKIYITSARSYRVSNFANCSCVSLQQKCRSPLKLLLITAVVTW